MCGFTGFTGKLSQKEQILNKMMGRILHRGPDMGGMYTDEKMALGFRRLSILDLSNAGAQPMYNEDKTIVCVFNGEIYNFIELRTQLEESGHIFACHSDTEVLLHGYEQWGDSLVEHLRGMFAFVIYDIKAQRLFAARDIFGIKPFYYAKRNDSDGIIFGSEIKSFLEHPSFEKAVNPDALRPYLTLQYSATDETFFKGVYKLPAAHAFSYENGEMKTWRYWQVNFTEQNASFDDCVQKLDAVMHESVSAHRISDVKVGSFLSGGVDSSYITACLMPNETFSVGFDYNKFNETDYAKDLSDRLGIENYRQLLTADDCFGAVSDIQYHMDEPQSNPSSVPLWFLAKLAREHVTVVLSGEGADEIFAGYEWYADNEPMKKYKKLPKFVRHVAADTAKVLPYFKGKNFIIKCAERPEDYFVGQALVFPESEATTILKPEYATGPAPTDLTKRYYKEAENLDEVTKKQYLDMKMWLPGDILLKADKMCMAHSLELRVPFLDKKVMEYAQTVPVRYRINNDGTKMVLRHAANKTLPDEWAMREKKGFPVPIKYWLAEEKYYNIVKEYFTAEYASIFFDSEKIIQLLDAHRDGKQNNARKIWTIFTFLVWYKRFFIDEK